MKSFDSSQINSVQIFITGGTFDKDYNYITGELYFKDTHLNEMLMRGRCSVHTDVKTLMMIDSNDMTDSDRLVIAHNCKQTPHQQIIITHGTDTMTDTGAYLKSERILGKTIILTGAMIPYAFGSSSDGFFNLGSAMAFAQSLDPGVYIVMNGRAFDVEKVEKNRHTGYFQIKK